MSSVPLFASGFAVFFFFLEGVSVAKRALPNPDMDGSKKPVEMICDDSTIFIGVIYNDLDGSDAADAVGVICWSKQKGEVILTPSDMGPRKRVTAKCDPETEVVSGIAYKDRAKYYNLPKGLHVKGREIPQVGYRRDLDEMDGVTVICRNTRTKRERLIELDDLAGGREYVKITGSNAVGIQYNDLKDSDAVDGVTLVVK